MIWYAIPSLLTISLIVTAFQWNWMRQARPNEKAVYFSLLGLGWVLAILLMVYPHLPGPSQFVNALFGRLGKTLIHGGASDAAAS